MAADPTVTHFASHGGKAAEHPGSETYAPLVAPATGDEHNTIRGVLIPFACWRVEDMRFEFDSSFPSPELVSEMQNLADLIASHPGCVLSVFGHADPVGDDDYNKFLSGRRAASIYGLLTRRPEVWDDLFLNGGKFTRQVSGDAWNKDVFKRMLTAVGRPDEKPSSVMYSPGDRKQLFLDYMNLVGAPAGPIPPDRFLARGEDPAGKGDFQGCSEFNPMMIFSADEQKKFDSQSDKSERNAENEINRRVMVLLFRKGTRVDPKKWPCPRAKEDTSGCRKRFWSDGEARRNTRLPSERREFEKTEDTFACRFYDRLANTSPCEKSWTGNGILHMQCFTGDGRAVLSGRSYRIRGNGEPPMQFTGVLDDTGTLRHENVPSGDYVLQVKGCSDEAKMVVLRTTDTIAQSQMLEDGALAIRVTTPEGDPIPDAKVNVETLGEKIADNDGVAYFSSVPDGEYKFTASKEGFTPVTVSSGKAKSSLVESPDETLEGSPESGEAKVDQKRTDVAVQLQQKPKVPPAKVVKIEGRQFGTRSFREIKKLDGKRLPENTLKASSSTSRDLKANPPVILLRGSEMIKLKAVTEPPDEIATWEVVPNENKGAAPGFDALGSEIEVKSDATGSFSAIAKLNGTEIVWNFVLVAVEVDTANSSSGAGGGKYQDLNEFLETPEGKKTVGLGPSDKYDKTKMTGVATGLFEFGKHGWTGEATVKLTGGGASGDLGCDRIDVQILQNLVEENVVGEYDKKLALSDAGFRILDAPGGSPDDWDGPIVQTGVVIGPPQRIVHQSPFLWTDGMVKMVKKEPRTRVIKMGDSPATGFDTRLNTEKLQRIRGATEFRATVAAYSRDSKNAISVYGETVWRADYTGDVSVSSGVGKWSSDGAGTVIMQSWKAIHSGSGIGTPAWNAQMEIFPPRAIDATAKPKRTMDKP